MALSFTPIGTSKTKEMRFKIPAALFDELDAGKKMLKEAGVDININEEVIRVLTKASAEIQNYLKENTSPSAGGETSPTERTPLDTNKPA